MVVTVSAKNYSLINACENDGDWTGMVPNDVTDFFKQGNQCVGFELWSSGNSDTYITGSWDLSGIKHFRFWLMLTCLKELNTDVNGGVQVYMSDGTNTGYWYVTGKTTYPGGWYNPVIDLSRAVDAGTKPTMSAITTIGFRFNLTAGAKKTQSLWIDHIYIGDGLIAYGDDGGSSFDLDDVLAADENVANGWGIHRKIGGVHCFVGSFEYGDNIGVNSCDFKDLSQVGIFEDRKVNANLYNITVVGNTTGTTKFQLGEQADTTGVSGCLIRTQSLTQTPKYDVTCTDANVSNFKLYGCNFLDADSISLPASGANREVLGCSFEKCGEVLPNTCKVEDCSFISADDRGCRISTASHGLKDCTFVSCPHCVHVNVSASVTFDKIYFIGSNGTDKWDIEHSVSGTLTVNCTGTPPSNPSYVDETGGGNTDIINTVTLKITCKNEAGLAIQGVRVRIERQDNGNLISEGETDSSGIYQDTTYNYLGDLNIKAIGRLKGYKNNNALDKITSIGLSIPFTMIKDPAVNLP